MQTNPRIKIWIPKFLRHSLSIDSELVLLSIPLNRAARSAIASVYAFFHYPEVEESPQEETEPSPPFSNRTLAITTVAAVLSLSLGSFVFYTALSHQNELHRQPIEKSK